MKLAGFNVLNSATPTSNATLIIGISLPIFLQNFCFIGGCNKMFEKMKKLKDNLMTLFCHFFRKMFNLVTLYKLLMGKCLKVMNNYYTL